VSFSLLRQWTRAKELEEGDQRGDHESCLLSGKLGVALLDERGSLNHTNYGSALRCSWPLLSLSTCSTTTGRPDLQIITGNKNIK
jgi:hypothetical protein